jgi:Cu(I)/Ag(I) efflux system protein CusF
MKRLVLTAGALGLAGLLAACGQKEAAKTETAAAPASASGMSGMERGASANMAKGTGTVTAVSADSVTIDHGPIPKANWPAMTMSFKASPDLAKQVKVGDKVAFDLKLQGGVGEITAIQKQ